MSTAYWKNLWDAWGEVVRAFNELVAAIARNIADPLHDDAVRANARIVCYTNDSEGVDKSIAYIRKLPPVQGDARESFIAYASALQQFVIFGADVYSAREFVKACVIAELHSEPGAWEHRLRVLGRIVSTGRISPEDYMALARMGIKLPAHMMGGYVAWEHLLPMIHDVLPHMDVTED